MLNSQLKQEMSQKDKLIEELQLKNEMINKELESRIKEEKIKE